MDFSKIMHPIREEICNWYSWGKSIEDLSAEYAIPVEGIKWVLEQGGKLEEYEEDGLPNGQLMKSIDVIVAYCPECGEMIELDNMCDKRVSPEGREEWLCSCSCGCDFWAYEDYLIDEHKKEREKKREELSKLSKEELINMLVR